MKSPKSRVQSPELTVTKMKAAVLCPGPSLIEFRGGTGYGAVIGVNRAAAYTPCDWWVICDEQTFAMCVPLGSPSVVCDQDCLARLLRKYPRSADYAWLDREHDWPPRKGPCRWWRFSATSALVLAARLGATHVDCYGVDWRGACDWDGYTHSGQCRTVTRWADERQVWQSTVDTLAERGVTVERITTQTAQV